MLTSPLTALVAAEVVEAVAETEEAVDSTVGVVDVVDSIVEVEGAVEAANTAAATPAAVNVGRRATLPENAPTRRP